GPGWPKRREAPSTSPEAPQFDQRSPSTINGLDLAPARAAHRRHARPAEFDFENQVILLRARQDTRLIQIANTGHIPPSRPKMPLRIDVALRVYEDIEENYARVLIKERVNPGPRQSKRWIKGVLYLDEPGSG